MQIRAQDATLAASETAPAPLIAHIIFRLDIGGLENGLVNLINHMPADRYRHAIICLTGYTDFRDRIERNVEVFALNKAEGKDFGMYVRLWRLLRELRPDVVHTRNLSTLDSQFVAALAGIRHRVHGEHGWDMIDLHGTSRKYKLLRRACRLLIHRYIPLSQDLERWLHRTIRVPRGKISRIYNGVDTERFASVRQGKAPLPLAGFASPENFVIGTVGRMETVKDQLTLVQAFLRLRERCAPDADRLRLVLVGEGELREKARALLAQGGAENAAWLAGARDDIPQILRSLDVFVLPSLNEGISNTILEAQASGLPVIATRVGGNPELVEQGADGLLVPPGDPQAMAAALEAYLIDPALAARHGANGRHKVVEDFSLGAMVQGYLEVYDRLLAGVSRSETVSRA